MKCLLALGVLCMFVLVKCDESLPINNIGKCEPITVPMCRNIQYNMTSMPNQFNHETQLEAGMEAHQFWALVEINCAKELRFFLCSLYTPICLPNYPRPIRACKSVCMRARAGCEKYMKKFGFDWPERMSCDLFPEYGSTKEVCMDPMDANEQKTNKKLTLNHNVDTKNKKADVKTYQPPQLDKELSKQPTFFDLICQKPFIKLSPNSPNFNKASTGNVTNCIQPCHSVYFNQFQQNFAYFWILIWSILCLTSSLCTTCTYLIESNRFRYPEKPIIYLSVCYLFVSFGYLTRFFSGHEELACNLDATIKSRTGADSTSLSCTASFLLTYYFGMASSAWWVIVSLTWFLAAGLKWGTEAISKYSTYFHIFAWLLPFIKTILILSMSLMDADSLSGLCSVGNLNTHALRVFIILPALSYLTIGMTFLMAGFVSLFRIRKLIKHQHGDLNKAHKLEKLMLRIGVFSILYTVPATCLIACYFYEQLYRESWERNLLCKRFKHAASSMPELLSEFCEGANASELKNGLSESPEFTVFILKYLMSLIVGVTSGFWIWTSKSLKSWKLFFSKLIFCCCCCCCRAGKQSQNDEDFSSESNQINEDSLKQPKKLQEKNEKSITFCLGKIFKMNSDKSEQKNSIVYFQANDDLENNPQNNFYAIEQTNLNQQQMQKLIGKNNQEVPVNVHYQHLTSVPVYQKPDSVVSFNHHHQSNNPNNTAGTLQTYYPTIGRNSTATATTNTTTTSSNQSAFNAQFPPVNMFQNCHTNKAAAFYYDYSSVSLPSSSNASSIIRK